MLDKLIVIIVNSLQDSSIAAEKYNAIMPVRVVLQAAFFPRELIENIKNDYQIHKYIEEHRQKSLNL